jgi:hypothetical protein
MNKIISVFLLFTSFLIISYTQQVNIPYLQVDNPENTFVAIIGNENYQDYRTDYTENAFRAIYDAERFRQYLINELNIPFKNISFYTDATTTHIKLYLSKLIKQSENARKNSELIFYFSGKYLEGGPFGKISLLPLDVIETDLAIAVTVDEVFRKLESSEAKRITILLDACRAKTSRNWSLLNDGGKSIISDRGEKDPRIHAYATKAKPQAVESDNTGIKLKKEVAVEIQSDDNQPPYLLITYPDVSASETAAVVDKTIIIKGKAEDKSGVYEVSVNGEEAHLEADGTFQAKILLGMGENKINVQAMDPKRNTSRKILVVERLPVEDVSTKTIAEETMLEEKKTSAEAKYYAILIGIDNYEDPTITDLNNPVSDTRKLYEILKTSYAFNQEDIHLLINAKREEIIAVFDELEFNLTENDNLLIFYAGHGYWDERTQKGYWLPADAKYDNTACWIRNSTITGYVSGIKARHTLLISDACFSGGIFKTRAAFTGASKAMTRLYELPSKKAMTSGTLKEVPDESVFLHYLTKNLQENQEKFMPAEKLFFSFKPAVLNNSENIPQFGVIKNAGDEGGDFIFVKN